MDENSDSEIFITQNKFKLNESYDTDTAVDAILSLENMSPNFVSDGGDTESLQATQEIDSKAKRNEHMASKYFMKNILLHFFK